MNSGLQLGESSASVKHSHSASITRWKDIGFELELSRRQNFESTPEHKLNLRACGSCRNLKN